MENEACLTLSADHVAALTLLAQSSADPSLLQPASVNFWTWIVLAGVALLLVIEGVKTAFLLWRDYY